MMPYAYELTPGQERSDWLMAEIPEGSTSCTIAYQEYKTDGSKGDAYFVEATSGEPAVAHSCRVFLLRYGGGVDCYGGTAAAQLAAAAQDGK